MKSKYIKSKDKGKKSRLWSVVNDDFIVGHLNILIIIFILFIGIFVHGQSSEINIFKNKLPEALGNNTEKILQNGTILFKKDNSLSIYSVIEALKLESEISFKMVRERKSRFNENMVFQKYQQYYKNVKIEKGGYSFSYNKKNDRSEPIPIKFTPFIYSKIAVDVNPLVNEEEIIENLQCIRIDSKELIITDRFDGSYKLVWKILYFDSSLKYAWVDAKKGDVLLTIGAWTYKNAPTEDYNELDMDDSNIGGETILREKNGSIFTYDFNKKNLYDIKTSDFHNDLIPTSIIGNDWTSNDADPNVFQAHWITDKTVELYHTLLDIDYELIHVGANCDNFDKNGVQLPNAGAFSTSTLQEGGIVIGHSNNSTLAEFDIIGHELGHIFLYGFLNYSFTGSASLHEGIADMFGVYIESEAQALDWEMGDNVPLIVRDLQNPEFDCFTDVQNFGQQEAHRRCTPLGYWFYQLIVGNSAQNIFPMDMNFVLDVIIESLESMNENSDYPDLRVATLNVVEEQFGLCSEEYMSFLNAWDFICVSGTEFIPVVFTSSIVNPSCQLDNGTITVNVECGQAPFSYLWSTGETTQTIENLAPGTYTVTVTDAAGTTAEEAVVVEPEVIIPASDPSWAHAISNNNLDNSKLENRNIYIEHNLIIDTDYTFENVTFSFADYGGLTIMEGINVEIKDLDGNKSILKACDADWRGVRVEDNAILTMENSEILNAYIGITTTRSDINLSHVDIIGNQGYAGIRTIGSMEGGTYETNIYNYRTGIYSLSNSKYPYFVKGEITNCTYGVSLIHSPGAIFNYEIEAYENPIVLLTSPGSIVGIIKFQAGIIGINAYNSSNLQIYKNDSENSNLETFAYLKNCPNSEISGNWNITARQYGIKALNSNLLKIADNNINVDGIPYIDGGAVKLTDCSSCTIQGNTIDANQCSFGIEYINGSGSDISDNNISVFSSISIRTAGIRILGSYLNLINNNIVNGVAHTAGILGQNSPGNTYDCDSVTTTGTGLGVYTNSLYQLIRGNALDISDTCLTIRSVIGKQYYHGNKFYSGEAVAVGLDENEIENSRFFVNPTIPYHRPPEVEPVDWFKNETETSFWDECGNGHGGKGKGNTGFDDPVALGLYFDNLKQIESNDPELFFVRMIHLLLYDYARDDYTLPADITQDPVWDSHPDISQIADLINQVNGIAGLSENSLLTEDDLIQLSDLQDAYINAQDSIDKENAYNDLKALMETLQPAFEYEYMQDSIAYAQLQNQFDLMSGTDISGKWADIYDDYIDFVQKGEVVEDNKAPLEEYSRLCSDMYGDAIHLTRALVNTYDNTYFDVYDGCLDIPLEPRFKENTLKALVQPNPAKNNITIQFDNEVTGYLTIYDISGKQVMNRDIDKA